MLHRGSDERIPEIEVRVDGVELERGQNSPTSLHMEIREAYERSKERGDVGASTVIEPARGKDIDGISYDRCRGSNAEFSSLHAFKECF